MFISLTTNAFTPNHFVVLHDKRKSPVVDLTFVSADDNYDDDSSSATLAVAVVSNYDDDTAGVADVSDDDADDYDEDKADDYDELVLMIRMTFFSTASAILPGGKPFHDLNLLKPKRIYKFYNALLSMISSVKYQNVEKTMFTLLSKTKTARTDEPKEKDQNSGTTEGMQ
ncbi:hypothetical protein PoB_001229700 [Plakobranchus ocellatus]|uniref:Uncharacterized protein n=1 Tax=Plakobranchus ocellatus TaxID=259542 RepID=A0AAV3YUF9_9GAST|nr:hypothetical protein PoB_001229700 [Plakobranchus ocellatus]